MDATSGGGAGGRGGGMGSDAARFGGAGLARFRSAPATWLDALLEEDLTRDDALKVGSTSGGLTQLLTAGSTNPPAVASSGLARSNSSSSYSIPSAADPGFFDAHPHHQSNLGGFHRQNSSPADFFSGNTDGYFSNFAMSGNYDFLAGSQMEMSPTGKRMRETDSDLPSPSKFTSQLKGEPSSLLDLEMDKLLEDSVPCRLRAKRGCATHPRSIAERVRRTRISDRIRKLQELVPNMDKVVGHYFAWRGLDRSGKFDASAIKQTNTADMLEEAVEYVKRLQEQIEELTELQKKCTCMAKE